ncbi:hypothetical protein BDE40_2845 [Litoreibacter halocynthiae]|uniref:Uncharacterized protein n=1 Tax=Litoreibacter halocynthiae TaxID=1242689 RepID=A0A4R7LJ35_9RHOB|nr:hypothetical protein [Litoreibacter halocynthiae]TDT74060.1 hypothetical protein BDE40_2845 [Litoreibacter halocynthiae]
MIRPEIHDLFWRYFELLIGAAIIVMGVMIFNLHGLLWQGIGAMFVVAGLAYLWTAWRRVRLTSKTHDGPGVVEVDERQITYFAPLGGGAVSINDLARVTILTDDRGPFAEDVHWLLEENGGSRLLIPNSAEGAAQLYDALAPLKGVDFEAAIRAMGSSTPDSFVIWAKEPARLH